MIKIGDKIRSVTDRDWGISVGGIYVVEKVRNMGDSSYVFFNDSNDNTRMRNFRNYELVTETPPATIQHEGYNYTRGEPVVPEWVKDGAWVVDTITDQVAYIEDHTTRGGWVVKLPNGSMFTVSHYFSGYDVSRIFRPFTNDDWKWGMWAEYEGEKVFVMNNQDKCGYIEIAMKPNHNTPLDGWSLVYPSELTPTTAP